jgi:hypothetical protein
MIRFIPLLTLLLPLLQACGSRKPHGAFNPDAVPPAPAYADLRNWAAHPAKLDSADRNCPDRPDLQEQADVDVFFLYPTTLTGSRRGEGFWNADVADAKLNVKTDRSSILYQASIFNGAGRVFAPRYRQAHIASFYGRDTASAAQALALAYADVQNAFRYYLENENQGRPFIIAGHSQGGLHGMYLLRDLIENTPLEKRFVAAYLAGWPIKNSFFRKIKPCTRPEETGCYCTWRTWERRYGRRKAFETDVVCTNPLRWTTEPGQYVPKTENQGGVVRGFCNTLPELADAEVYKGILLCSKPKFPGSIFFIRKNYHIGDLNLYYMNVRNNARLRADAFFRR